MSENIKPVAFATTNEDGERTMLFFDRDEATLYCDDDEEPECLFDTAALDTLLAAKERETIERCAKLCESLFDMDDDSCNEAETCADALRALLPKEQNETQP